MSNELHKLKEGAEHRSVLIVDDDRELADSLTRIFRLFFKECIIASDGEEAYTLFNERHSSSNPFTLVITDLELPKMGGLRLIRQIRSLSQKQPILILSAHDESEYMAEAIRLDVEGYLLKPLAMPKLFESLEKIFAQHHNDQQPHHNEIDPITGWKTFHELADTIQTLETMPLTLLRIRINHLNNMFTYVGDTFANEYLSELSTLIKTLLNNIDVEFYRTANDEFCLALKGDALEDAENIAANLVSTVRYFHTAEKGIILNSSISIGIAYGKEHLLRHSKLALEKVSNDIGGGYAFFTSSDHEENLALNKSREMLKMIFNALHEENIVPFFQPIRDLSSNELYAYESVVRIRKDKELYGPESFWSLAIDMGQMGMITRSMIRHTFEQQSSLPLQKPIILTLTAYDLNDESLLPYIDFWQQRFLIEPSQICFQIIEGVKTLQNPFVLNFIQKLQERGFKIGLNDFGMGECNLTTLLSLKPDLIKLHSELVTKGHHASNYRPIIIKLVEIIHTIGAKAIAPTINSSDQFQSLIQCNIDYACGDYVGLAFQAGES